MVALDYGGAQEVSAFDHLNFSEVTDVIKAVARSVKAASTPSSPKQPPWSSGCRWR
jgi:hypothetical protein